MDTTHTWLKTVQARGRDGHRVNVDAKISGLANYHSNAYGATDGLSSLAGDRIAQ